MSALLAALHLVVLAQAPVTSVSLDLRGLPEGDYRQLDGLGLERKVTLRLIQEGFAVVAPDHPAAQLRLRVTRIPGGLLLEAVGSDGRRSQRVDLESAATAELHLEVAQRLAELSRGVEVAAGPPPLPDPGHPPSPVGMPDAGMALGLSLGTLWRGPAVDPHLLLAGRGMLGPLGVGLELGGAGLPAAELSVLELQGGLFVSHRLALAPGLHLEPGLGVGAVIHAFRLSDPWASEQAGLRTAAAGWARVEAGWRFHPRWSLGLRVALGALGPLAHQIEGATLWSRSSLRVETALGLAWTR